MSSHSRRRLAALLTAVLVAALAVGAAGTAAAHDRHRAAPGTVGTVHVDRAHSLHSGEPLQVAVSVSYRGFNGHPDLTIEAVAGQLVEITFVWADEAVPDNAHRFLLRGYELRTELIDRENRETTLRFVAERTGTFELVCDWRCEGHREALQDARLTVVDIGAEEGPMRPSVTSLMLAARGGLPDAGPISLSASLTDADGQPLVSVPVRFYLRAVFAGVDGEMEIAAPVTDERGVAVATYTPTFAGEHQFVVRFAGAGPLAESEETLQLTVAAAEPAYVVAPRGLDAVARAAPLVLALVVLSVWATFGYVLFQVVRIRRCGVAEDVEKGEGR
jgi:hypothetical protein